MPDQKPDEPRLREPGEPERIYAEACEAERALDAAKAAWAEIQTHACKIARAALEPLLPDRTRLLTAPDFRPKGEAAVSLGIGLHIQEPGRPWAYLRNCFDETPKLYVPLAELSRPIEEAAEQLRAVWKEARAAEEADLRAQEEGKRRELFEQLRREFDPAGSSATKEPSDG